MSTTVDVRALRSLADTVELASHVTARCDACGASWEYARHDALLCPFCSASFTYAHMSSAPPIAYIDFDAEGGAAGG